MEIGNDSLLCLQDQAKERGSYSRKTRRWKDCASLQRVQSKFKFFSGGLFQMRGIKSINIFIITDDKAKSELEHLIKKLSEPEFGMEIRKILQQYTKDDKEKTWRSYK